METLSISRRGMITAAAASPIIVAFGPSGPTDPWTAALDNYVAARRTHEAFIANALDPIARAAEAAGRALSPRVIALEREGDDLCSTRQDALRALVETASPTLAALQVKAHLAYEEAVQFDDAHGYVRAILTDLDHLAISGEAIRRLPP